MYLLVRIFLSILALCLSLRLLLTPEVVSAQTAVFINEIHYDNAGSDVDEGVEIAGPPGTDLTGWSLVFYNGGNGRSYATINLNGVIPGQQDDGCGVLSFLQNGIQNGVPDGVALVDDTSSVLQFLSYEGSFVAVGGPADGLTSADLGVLESTSTPVGHSLQLVGTGTVAEDFTWISPSPDSFGEINEGQTLIACSAPVAASVIINEVDIDQTGDDDAEFIELYDGGAGNTALDGLVVVLYNGSSGDSYSAFDLDGFKTDANGYFVLGSAGVTGVGFILGSNTLQNGADAIALHFGDASDFPDGSPVTTEKLLDAVVYDTDDADDDVLLLLLNAGEPQVNENGASDKDGHSNQRCPNGSGGQRNTISYVQETPTPGASNQCGAEPSQGTITIIKEAKPADGTDFSFFSDDLGDFVLDDANDDDNDGIADRITFMGMTPGEYIFTESVPFGWTVEDISCLSPDPNDTTTTVSDDGMVFVDLDAGENITCTFKNELPLDYGDAPDPTFATLLARNGARHIITGDLYLGAVAAPDPEVDGQPDLDAIGDDTNGSDDEDGVAFTASLVAGNNATIDVTASAPGLLNAWVDFNGDGDWNDEGEQIFTDDSLAAGVNNLSFSVPHTDSSGKTYARFRLDSEGGLSFDGRAQDGEVEDYVVEIMAPYGTIIVQERVEPGTGTDFGFTDNIEAPHTFSLDDGQIKTFSKVTPGIYTVTEENPLGHGYRVIDIACDDGGSARPSITHLSTRQASINLEGGEMVTCTFTNKLAGDLDNDGDVDINDYASQLQPAFGTCLGHSSFNPEGDYDDDDCIGLMDLHLWFGLFRNAS